MNSEKIKLAVQEAKRFLERAKKVEAAQMSETKDNAALLRTSMELTRALAELRKPS